MPLNFRLVVPDPPATVTFDPPIAVRLLVPLVGAATLKDSVSMSFELVLPLPSAAPANTSDEVSPGVIFRLAGRLLITGTSAVPLLPCAAGCIALTVASLTVSLSTVVPLISRTIVRSV